MPRYVTLRQPQRQRSWYDFGHDHEVSAPPLGQPSVYDPGPVDTGILDKDGNRIYRTPDAIGFVRSEE